MRPMATDFHALDTDRPAGVVSRFTAAVVDGITVVVLMGLIYLMIAFIWFLTDVASFSFPAVNWVFTTTGFILTAVAYLTICWAVSGRTAGSAIMGLRLVTTKGNRVRFAVALVRAVTCVFFPVGLFWSAVSKNRKSVQDIIFRTKAVYSR